MTVYLMTSLQKIPYIHRKYMVLANPTNIALENEEGFKPSQTVAMMIGKKGITLVLGV
jgi:histidinol phosphatase-like PHP family hydrolase